jgi:hypothetical protein
MTAIELSKRAKNTLRAFMTELFDKRSQDPEWTGVLNTTYGDEIIPLNLDYEGSLESPYHDWYDIADTLLRIVIEMSGPRRWGVKPAYRLLAAAEEKEISYLLALHPSGIILDSNKYVREALAGVALFTLDKGHFIVLPPASLEVVHERRQREAALLRTSGNSDEGKRLYDQWLQIEPRSEAEVVDYCNLLVAHGRAALENGSLRGMRKYDIAALIEVLNEVTYGKAFYAFAIGRLMGEL